MLVIFDVAANGLKHASSLQGPRTNPWFQECGPRIMEAGDLLAFDTDLISTYGYCCDISRTWMVGDVAPDETQKKYRDAYEHVMTNIEVIKPGMTFAQVTQEAHRLPEEYRALRWCVGTWHWLM